MVAIHRFTKGWSKKGKDGSFEYENTRSDVKCYDYWEKWKKKYVRLPFSIPGTQGQFLDKVNPDMHGFTDELVFNQYDVQVVENTFIDDYK